MGKDKKNEPKYGAYKPVEMTNGIRTWTQHTFDNTVQMTPDDMEMLASVITALSPKARITSMQARLDSLQNVTPEIKLHVDAIRAIHARLDNNHDVGPHGLDELDRADALWREIIVLSDVVPLARKGVQFNPGKPKGAISPVAKKIKAYLQKHPAAKPDEVWQALEKSPPAGHVFMDTAQFGKYIESGAKTVMKWERFRNLVSEHRPKK